MSLPETYEADVLDSVLPQYEAEGFEVYVNPAPSILPSFMREHRPDAIALRTDKKIAIEVVRSRGDSTRKIQELRSLFATHPDWELRVHYVSPLRSDKSPDVVPRAAIDLAIERVLNLKNEGHKLPALIMAWATLEGIGRALLPDRLRRPQTPARLIEVLASEGYLTPQEADTLRGAIPLRNLAVHGSIDQVVEDRLLDEFVGVLRTLACFLAEAGLAARSS